MKKQALAVLLVLAMLLGMLPMTIPTASAATIAYPVDGGNIYFDIATGTITASDSYITKANIPSEIDGVAVTSIGVAAFSESDWLTSVTLPEGLTSIETYAFYKCNRLTSITIPGSLTSIGYGAFEYCYKLSSVTLPEGLTSIGDWAFYDCTSLSSITIPSSVTSIGEYAFAYCKNLSGIWVDKANTVYSSDTFGVLFNKGKTTLIQFPNGYYGSYDIPDGITSIAEDAFLSCDALTSITIPGSLTSIGHSAFYGCQNLSSITICEGVTQIEGYVFYSCINLSSVTLPESLTSIGCRAFFACKSLSSITIPKNVFSIDDYAFGDCYSLTSVYFKGDAPLEMGDNVFSKNGPTLYYYEGRAGWTSPTWHGYPTDTWGPSPVVAYPVTGGNIYFDKETGAVTKCDWGVTAADIPERIDGVFVTSIGDAAFQFNGRLTSVTLPSSLKSIGEAAFSDCGTLTSVTIPDGVESIGKLAFYGCSSLTSITLPSTVRKIGIAAFADCSALEAVCFYGNAPELGERAFDGTAAGFTLYYLEGKSGWTRPYYCGYPTDIWGEISYPVTGGNIYLDKRTGAVTRCDWGVTAANIPERIEGILVTSIGNAAFQYNGRLTSVTLPGSLESIGEEAFSDCTALTSVTIPEGVTTLGDLAFFGCNSLTSIKIPNSVCEIGVGAFADCSKLRSVTIPKNVEAIGESAFSNCTALASVTLQDGLKSIGGWAFADCTSLKSIIMPSSVQTIQYGAFEGCSNLKDVYFFGDAPTLGDVAFDRTHPDLKLYYIKDKFRWTSPYYSGYPTATWLGYVDVPNNAWYYTAVAYAIKNGLMNGMSATTFEPETSMTRAMLVTVLWRYAGEPIEGLNSFTDVHDSDWYSDAVNWAAINGIVGGVGNNKFDPNGKITREQLATILYRYASSQLIETSARDNLKAFPDAKNVSPWASDAMRWAVAEGLINGSDGKLLPQGNATRAQVATILMRFIENVAK